MEETSTSRKAKVLLRLSALGAKEADLSLVREALFSSKASSSEGADHDSVKEASPLNGNRRISKSTQEIAPIVPNGNSISPNTAVASVNNELMSYFRQEFSRHPDSRSHSPLNATSFDVEGGNEPQLASVTGEEETKLPEDTVKMVDSWFNFDVFDFAVKVEAEGGVLVRMGELLFDRHGFRSKYHISSTVLRSFLTHLQAGYIHDLPYHNAIHAADVAQSMSHFIVKCGLGQKGDEIMRFAAIVAALGHDVGHPGYSNRYLIETRSPLALVYNDKSPLENMHASKLFTIMWGRTDKKCDITANMDRARDVARFRKLAIEMILATDNGHHEKVLQKVKEDGDDESVFKAAMHAADLGGGAKTIPLAHQWANRVLQEFFRQGDAERVLNLYPVLPVMDRHNPMPKGVFQEGFIRQICLPVYVTLNNVPGLDLSLQVKALEEIARHWVAHTSAPVAKLKETRSFSLLQKSAQNRRNSSAINWDQVTDHHLSNTKSAPGGKLARNLKSSSAKQNRQDNLTSDEEEEGMIQPIDDDLSVPKHFPVMRSRSDDEVMTTSRDVRHRLNLSPRTFMSEGLEGVQGKITMIDRISPPVVVSPAPRSAVRDAVQRARAAKGSSTSVASQGGVESLNDVEIMKASRVTTITPGAPVSTDHSDDWRPPISPQNFRPFTSPGSMTGTATSASLTMMTATEAAKSASKQSAKKSAQRDQESMSSPSRRRKRYPPSTKKSPASPAKKSPGSPAKKSPGTPPKKS